MHLPLRKWKLSLIGIFTWVLPSAHAVQPKVIYGNDDRVDYYQEQNPFWRKRADATVALIRKVNLEDRGDGMTHIKTLPYGTNMGLCKTEPFYEQETAAFCSGFLVSPDTIVTAGHCVTSQQSCDNTKFVFGFRFETAGQQPRDVATDGVYSCSRLVFTASEPSGQDLAVIKLDRPVTQAAPLAFRKSGQIQIGEGLKVIGYPVGLPVKLAGGASVRSIPGPFLVANLDTYGGNSGSSVFNSATGEVEGILVRGEMDFEYENGCRVSHVCKDESCRGEDVTLFERVLPYLDN